MCIHIYTYTTYTYTTLAWTYLYFFKFVYTSHDQTTATTATIGSGGRLCTRFLGSQVHADGSGPGSQVHHPPRVTASSVHAVRGLICTRGQEPRLYTRNGFAVCTPLFLQLCILCAPGVQVVRYRSLAVLPLCILCAPCVQVVRFITMPFGHV